MEIGFDAKRLFNNTTGLGNYSRTLVRNLQLYYPEHSYHLYSSKTPNNENTKGFHEATFKTHSPNSLKPFWRSHTITRDLRKHGIQVFHGLSHQLPQGIHRSGIRTVVTVHDLIHKIFPETYSSIDRKVYDLRLRYALKHADHIVAISDHTRLDVLKYFDLDEERVSVVYQACDPLFYDDEKQSLTSDILPSEYLLYVGAIAARKNLLNLITAYAQTKDLPPLLLVGRGTKKYKTQLLSEARRLKVIDKLIFLENIHSTKELKAIYQNCKAFIYPSWYEGFGIPVVEAALCKVPVLTSATSSLPEAAGPDSILINPFDLDQLSLGLKKVLDTNESTLDKSYEYAKQHFEPGKCSGDLMKVYDSL